MYAGRDRRGAPALHELFAAPRHPYTSGLLGSRAAPRRAAASALARSPGQPPVTARSRRRAARSTRAARRVRALRAARCRRSRARRRGGHPTACFLDDRGQAAPAPRATRASGSRELGARDRALRCSRCADLTVHFPVAQRACSSATRQTVKAVDGVTLRRRPRRDARRRGRVRVRQVDAGARDPAAADKPTCGRDHVRRAATSRALSRTRLRAAAPRDADGLPGSVRVAQPAHARRSHRRRAARRPRARDAGASAARGCASCSSWSACRAEQHNRYPARVLGRPAPAHRHRARARRPTPS